MQHDLFANPNRRERSGFPLIVVLQADVAEGTYRLVAPLTGTTALAPKSRLMPVVEHCGSSYLVVLNLMTTIPLRLLRHPVGSIAQYRDDLTRALDWLFWGV
jgi:hypothetical protein